MSTSFRLCVWDSLGLGPSISFGLSEKVSIVSAGVCVPVDLSRLLILLAILFHGHLIGSLEYRMQRNV